MNPSEYKSQIGAIVGNLQSLEFALRWFLSESVGPRDTNLKLDKLQAGDLVAETHLTNYDSLGQVIRKVNARLAARASLTWASLSGWMSPSWRFVMPWRTDVCSRSIPTAHSHSSSSQDPFKARSRSLWLSNSPQTG